MIPEVVRCSRCRLFKARDQFRPNRGRGNGLQPYCRPCDKLHQAEWYARNREAHKKRAKEHRLRISLENLQRVLDYLRVHPCVDCGESDALVLQFDHVRDTKVACVKAMVLAGRCWKSIEKEIAKCEVRCANCHVRRTAKQFGWRAVALLENATLGLVG